MPWRIQAYDGTAFLTLTYFRPWPAPSGRIRRVRSASSAVASNASIGNQIVHPDYLVDAAKAEDIPEFEAIYPATAGLNSRTVRKLAIEALHLRRSFRNGRTAPGWSDSAGLAGAPPEALHAPRCEADLSTAGAASAAAGVRRTALPPAGVGAAQERATGCFRLPPILTDGLAARAESALPFRLAERSAALSRRNPRGYGVGSADEPAAPGRCRRRQDAGGAAGHGRTLASAGHAVGPDGAHRNPGAAALSKRPCAIPSRWRVRACGRCS